MIRPLSFLHMWRPYLQLVRLPNTFTAFADVLMGYLVTHGSANPWPPLVLLMTFWGLPRIKGAAVAVMWHLGLKGDEKQ